MSECEICGKEDVKTTECTKCGTEFCDECGDSSDEECKYCKNSSSEEKDDFSDLD